MKTRGAKAASGIECLVLKTTSTRSRRSASGTATWSQSSFERASTTRLRAAGWPCRSRAASEAKTSTYSFPGSPRTRLLAIRCA